MGIIRESFLIFASWDNAIRVAPDDVQLELYHALMDWAKTGTKPDGLSWQAEMLMKSIERDMEGNIAKYNAAVENGKKGGNPNFKKGQSNPYYNNEKITKDNSDNQPLPSDNLSITEDNRKITQDNPDITQDNPDITLDDNDNVYVYVNKLVKENKNNKLLNISARAHTREEIFDYLKERYSALFSYYPSYKLEIEEIINELCNLIESASEGIFKFNKRDYSLEEMCAVIDSVKVSDMPGLINSIIYNKSIENKQLYIFGALLNIAIKKL